MPHRSQRYQAQLEKRGAAKEALPLDEAIQRVLEMAKVPASKSYKQARPRKGFDQTIEIVLHLGIDPKQADQVVRGSVSLPRGIGKTRRVIAFCPEDMVEQAKAAGAIEAGGDELIARIQKGWMDFDVAVAHPQMMSKVGKLGRILGPKGLMPSPKAGTVTTDIETAIREYGAGKVEYRCDSGGNVHAVVGKASFEPQALKENIEVFIDHVRRNRPAAAKGQFIKKVCLSGTMTPAVMVQVA